MPVSIYKYPCLPFNNIFFIQDETRREEERYKRVKKSYKATMKRWHLVAPSYHQYTGDTREHRSHSKISSEAHGMR